MSYRFRKKSLAREVHRVAREELEGTLKELLTVNDQSRSTAVHEARKHPRGFDRGEEARGQAWTSADCECTPWRRSQIASTGAHWSHYRKGAGHSEFDSVQDHWPALTPRCHHTNIE
ncbi:MAG: hypothetical protein WBL40_00165, partial [Terrimicrobiaceae bacterium]